MVGNDIVDLRDPESRSESLHPRFDTRVFSESERAVIGEADDSERVRWKLWAAKEAAYKLARKLAPPTVFSPRLYQVTPSGDNGATVDHEASCCTVRYTENDGALHAVATSRVVEPSAVLSDWRRLRPGEIASGDPNAPSRAVRELLCEQIAERLGVAISELEVRRQGRVPFLFVSGQPARVDLSLSHHGDWLGFACELEPAVPGALVR